MCGCWSVMVMGWTMNVLWRNDWRRCRHWEMAASFRQNVLDCARSTDRNELNRVERQAMAERAKMIAIHVDPVVIRFHNDCNLE